MAPESALLIKGTSHNLLGHRMTDFAHAHQLKTSSETYYRYLLKLSHPGWDRLSPEQLNLLVIKNRLKDLRPSTARGCLRVWRSFLGSIGEVPLEISDLASSLDATSAPVKEGRLTSKTIPHWWLATKVLPFSETLSKPNRHQGKIAALQLRALLVLGCSYSVLANLRWSDINEVDRTVLLNGRTRPFSNLLEEVLIEARLQTREPAGSRGYPHAETFVFPTAEGGAMKSNRRWRKRIEEITEYPFTNNDLRRTFMHIGLSIGQPRAVVRALAGYQVHVCPPLSVLTKSCTRIDKHIMTLVTQDNPERFAFSD